MSYLAFLPVGRRIKTMKLGIEIVRYQQKRTKTIQAAHQAIPVS